jgi:hypothetical protein
LKERKAVFIWNNRYIDTSIKEFVKKKSEIRWIAQWRTQYRIYKWANEKIFNSTDWISTWALLHGTKIISNYTSNEDQKYRSFNTKVLNDELPVMKNLNIRKPGVYKDNKCVFCKSCVEDSIHVFLCQDQAEKTKQKFENKLLDAILEYKDQKIADRVKLELLNKSIFKIDLLRQINGTSAEDMFDLTDCLRGLVPVILKNILTKCGCNTEDNKLILREWYKSCREYMFNIWIERCKKILEWEKAVGITKLMKKSRSKNAILKHPDYADTKIKLELFMHKIINRTIDAVYCTGTKFFSNIFCKIDFGEVVTS